MGEQGVAGGQEAEAPAQEPGRSKMPVDLVMGSTLPERGEGGARESKAC